MSYALGGVALTALAGAGVFLWMRKPVNTLKMGPTPEQMGVLDTEEDEGEDGAGEGAGFGPGVPVEDTKGAAAAVRGGGGGTRAADRYEAAREHRRLQWEAKKQRLREEQRMKKALRVERARHQIEFLRKKAAYVKAWRRLTHHQLLRWDKTLYNVYRQIRDDFSQFNKEAWCKGVRRGIVDLNRFRIAVAWELVPADLSVPIRFRDFDFQIRQGLHALGRSIAALRGGNSLLARGFETLHTSMREVLKAIVLNSMRDVSAAFTSQWQTERR